jgi:hypothetical protein
MSDEDVLGDAQVRENRWLLVDGGDSMPLGVAGRADRDRFTRYPDFTSIGLVDAGDDLDEGRLSGPVLAEQGVDLPWVQG